MEEKSFVENFLTKIKKLEIIKKLGILKNSKKSFPVSKVEL